MTPQELLDQYSGQTTEELLALEGRYRTYSLIMAFEQALGQKFVRKGADAMSIPELDLLAIESLEREVMNGGFSQFFINSSAEYSLVVAAALTRIGCPKTAALTQRAIGALRLKKETPEAVTAAALAEDEDRDKILEDCDQTFFAYEENLADKLLAYIRANKTSVRL